jgi:hypothetical protein
VQVVPPEPDELELELPPEHAKHLPSVDILIHCCVCKQVTPDPPELDELEPNPPELELELELEELLHEHLAL